MAKNNPVINHTKIIAYAIQHIEAELAKQAKICEGNPAGDALMEHFNAMYAPELDALKQMYFFETGVEYV